MVRYVKAGRWYDASILDLNEDSVLTVTKIDRKSVVQGKSVDLGGRRIIKKKNKQNNSLATYRTRTE